MTSSTWTTVLRTLLDGHDLTSIEASWAMNQIAHGGASDAQTVAFLTALRIKGESSDEVSAFVAVLRSHAISVDIPGSIVDIAGTGGDRTGAVNISTMAAVVAAATGLTVLKHGGRSASSPTAGSADLLEQLGVPLTLAPSHVVRIAKDVGIAYLFAPTFNPGLHYVAAVRRQLGFPTVLNAIAPLLNPANPQHQVVGVSERRMAPIVAETMAVIGRSGMVVRGRDGLDNLTTVTTSDVWIVRRGTVTQTTVDPRDLDVPLAESVQLRGGGAAENAATFRAVLDGTPGPVRDVVLLNAAAVLVATSSTSEPLIDALRSARARCADAIDTGAARAKLDRLIAVSSQIV